MRRTSEAELKAVLLLDGPKRFKHFIKRAADEERVWGLWDDGWATMGDDEGNLVFPLWPAREYADISRTGDWESFTPKAIDLYDLMDTLLPTFKEESTLIGVFPTPEGQAVLPSLKEFLDALRLELQRYESS